jgi:hypothetical protein
MQNTFCLRNLSGNLRLIIELINNTRPGISLSYNQLDSSSNSFVYNPNRRVLKPVNQT